MDDWDDPLTTPWPPEPSEPDIGSMYPLGKPVRTRGALNMPALPPGLLLGPVVAVAAAGARLLAQAFVPGTTGLPLFLVVLVAAALGIIAVGLSDRLGTMVAASLTGFVALALAVGEHTVYVTPALLVLAGLLIGRVRTR